MCVTLKQASSLELQTLHAEKNNGVRDHIESHPRDENV